MVRVVRHVEPRPRAAQLLALRVQLRLGRLLRLRELLPLLRQRRGFFHALRRARLLPLMTLDGESKVG